MLDNKWQDKPYKFYFHPKNDSGTREVKNTFDMDWNLYFNPTQKLDQVKLNGKTWEEWRKLGKDTHSVYADPLFVDPDRYDFNLKPDSPAFALGFQPIDMSTVGPRQK